MTEMRPSAGESRESTELQFLNHYHRRKPQYDRVLGQLLALFEEYRRLRDADAKLRVHSIRGRIKTCDSLLRKARQDEGLKNSDPATIFREITDVVGARIVCNTLEGKAAACNWLEEQARQNPAPFRVESSKNVLYSTGYRSQHYLIRLTNEAWPTLRLLLNDRDDDVTVEVQVRTILEEAWGEIEHDLVYKSDKVLPLNTIAIVVKPGFKALSHRLHDADILVHGLTKRIVDKPTPTGLASAVAKQQRSLELDVMYLGVDDEEARKELDIALSEAEGKRIAGDNDEAFRLHKRLLDDARFSPARARRVLMSEMGLDRLIQAETLLREGVEGKLAARLLEESADYYNKAAEADPDGNNVIVHYRQSQVAILQKRFDVARSYLERSLALLNERGRPDYLRTTFYKARLRSKLAALDLGQSDRLAIADPPVPPEAISTPLERAGQSLWDAKGDHEAARADRSPQSKEWMRDALAIYNNLAWFLFRKNDFEKARAIIDIAKNEVEAGIWEQDVHFLGTILAIELALLPQRPTFDELTWLDSVRIRILNILQMGGSFVFREAAESMLNRIRVFEERWRKVALESILDGRAERSE